MSNFTVYPAIELRGGMGLRYENLGMGTRANRVDAVKLAREFEKAGAAFIHIVNLDGPFLVAGRRDSSLARYATVTLDASVPVEACPLNLAP